MRRFFVAYRLNGSATTDSIVSSKLRTIQTKTVHDKVNLKAAVLFWHSSSSYTNK